MATSDAEGNNPVIVAPSGETFKIKDRHKIVRSSCYFVK